jgi:hypothetical protein
MCCAEPSYEREIGTQSGKQKSAAYNDNIRTQTVRYAMIEQMQRPPHGWADVVRAHFFLRKAKILGIVTDWAKTTPGVKALLPQLKSELEKLQLPSPPADSSAAASSSS